MRNPFRSGDLPYFAFLPALGSAAWWAVEQKVTTADDWAEKVQAFPAWPVWFFLGLAVAVILMEPFRPSSRTIQFWRYLNRCVRTDFAAILTEESPRANVVKIRLRAVRDLEGLRLIGRGYSCSHMHRPATQVIFARRHEPSVASGQPIDLIVGLLAIPHPGWTPWSGGWSAAAGEPAPNLIANSDNVIEIDVRSGFRRQRLRFYLRIDEPGAVPQTFAKILREDIDLFDPGPHKVRLGWAE